MDTLIAILQVALALGFVIFVHELGHFAVAKMCGVRCDKFFIGFDVGGYKLSRQWGETEYGIGILPLGGYVKMFGQDDNAANIEQELEEAQALEGSPDAKQIVGPGGEKRWVHKRSYLAKSVPQRMAIISAGVIMNIIFAFIFAWIAYGIGVPQMPAVLGQARPGSPSWEAALRPGDRFARINDIENPTYKQLVEQVILGDMERGLDCTVERAGQEPHEVKIQPRMSGPVPQIGFNFSNRLRLAAKGAVRPFTPASELGESGFKDNDQIVAIDGQPVATFHELSAVLYEKKADPITYTVVRGGKAPAGDPLGVPQGGERVELTVAPNRMERLGIVPTLGPIVALAQGSPADEAGLREGDQLLAVDGAAIGAAPNGQEGVDPVTLADRLNAIARRGEATSLTVRRPGQTEPIEISLTPRVANWQSRNTTGESPIALDAIGAACDLQAEVAAIVDGSPAAGADLRPGDRLTAAKLVSSNEEDGIRGGQDTFELGEGARNWPLVLGLSQDKSKDFKVELTVSRGEKTHEVTLTPQPVEDAHTPARGMLLTPLKTMKVATDVSEQTQLAWAETRDSLMQVVKFIQKLGGQVSVTALGGPITIAATAGGAAYEGIGALLVFLTMLSANLAVLNFLPIPVLDGGHMVFLAYEGITGRPVNERVMIALQVLGLAMLLGLMLFVSTLDITRLIERFL